MDPAGVFGSMPGRVRFDFHPADWIPRGGSILTTIGTAMVLMMIMVVFVLCCH